MPPEWQLERSVHVIMIFPTAPPDAIKQLLRFLRFDNFRDALLESVELDSCRRVLCHAHSKTSLGSVYLSESRAHDRYIL